MLGLFHGVPLPQAREIFGHALPKFRLFEEQIGHHGREMFHGDGHAEHGHAATRPQEGQPAFDISFDLINRIVAAV